MLQSLFLALLVTEVFVQQCGMKQEGDECDIHADLDPCAPGLFCSLETAVCARLFSLAEGKKCNYHNVDGFFSECQTHLYCDIEDDNSIIGTCVLKLQKGEQCGMTSSKREDGCGEGLVCPKIDDKDKRVCVEVFSRGVGEEALIVHECEPHLMLSNTTSKTGAKTCEVPNPRSNPGCSDAPIALTAVFAHTGWPIEKASKTPLWAHCDGACELVVRAEKCNKLLKNAFKYYTRFWDARGQDYALWLAETCLENESFGDYPVDTWSWSALEVLFFVLVLFFFLLTIASVLLIVKYRSKSTTRAASSTANLLNS
eukprot:TRINITY_DN66476_c10_g2_i2.p1 TRINITY_DN66476_c10_g2~~TRINITY_DN66476_c10_g2_i2.p1  ORF type:complete len:313 (+),score=22.35 TRINITY_DN66476_c10_g2_i2:23-961(+)